jgi:hypothetical protein
MSFMGVVASLRAPVGSPLPDIGFDLFSFVPVPNVLTNALLALIVRISLYRQKVLKQFIGSFDNYTCNYPSTSCHDI